MSLIAIQARPLSSLSSKCYNPFICLYALKWHPIAIETKNPASHRIRNGGIEEKRKKLQAIVHLVCTTNCVRDLIQCSIGFLFIFSLRDFGRCSKTILQSHDSRSSSYTRIACIRKKIDNST